MDRSIVARHISKRRRSRMGTRSSAVLGHIDGRSVRSLRNVFSATLIPKSLFTGCVMRGLCVLIAKSIFHETVNKHYQAFIS
jgi:hypothetical protein